MSGVMAAGQAVRKIYDPLEPRIMPQDGKAWFAICRMEGGRLRQQLHPLSDYAQIISAMAGAVDTYVSQTFFATNWRRVEHFAWATHAYVDLDTYRDERLRALTPREIVFYLIGHCNDCNLPLPSIIVSSGRGYYAKWFWSAPIGHREAGRAAAVHRALVQLLRAFKADPKAVDLARVLRIPGTINSKSGRSVEIVYEGGPESSSVKYDFDAFARAVLPLVTEVSETQDKDTAASRSRPRLHTGNNRFNRHAWHEGVLEDLRRLAAIRYPGGIVQPGLRDLFGHVAACQLAMLEPSGKLLPEIIAFVGELLPADYVKQDLRRHCGTLLQRDKAAKRGERVSFADRERTPVYTYRKQRIIELLEITPSEQQQMTRLISNTEKSRRQTERRRAAGVVERDEYQALAASRRSQVAELRERRMSCRAIAAELGISKSEVQRLAPRCATMMSRVCATSILLPPSEGLGGAGCSTGTPERRTAREKVVPEHLMPAALSDLSEACATLTPCPGSALHLSSHLLRRGWEVQSAARTPLCRARADPPAAVAGPLLQQLQDPPAARAPSPPQQLHPPCSRCIPKQRIARAWVVIEHLMHAASSDLSEPRGALPSWLDWLPPEDAALIVLRAQGVPWKGIAYRFGISVRTAQRRRAYALAVIAWRAHGRPLPRTWSRRFLLARVKALSRGW